MWEGQQPGLIVSEQLRDPNRDETEQIQGGCKWRPTKSRAWQCQDSNPGRLAPEHYTLLSHI